MQDLTVLVVDDMRSMRSIVKGVLSEMGFKNMCEASDGSEALSVLRSKKIDLVISDVEMPKMDGIQLLEEVDQDEELRGIPFIMLTAMNDKEKVLEILQHKVHDFVLKPINPQMLEQRVQAFLNENPPEVPDLDA
jgi:two-component system, chemotaxis family, chemotaxis protein CheY